METSSTEDFWAATRATLSSNFLTSSRDREVMGSVSLKSSFRENMSVTMSGASRMTRLGGIYPLVLKSIRMTRAFSRVKVSRQNGQAGERRGDVLEMIFSQQPRHST